jgi:hypothetical protein
LPYTTQIVQVSVADGLRRCAVNGSPPRLSRPRYCEAVVAKDLRVRRRSWTRRLSRKYHSWIEPVQEGRLRSARGTDNAGWRVHAVLNAAEAAVEVVGSMIDKALIKCYNLQRTSIESVKQLSQLNMQQPSRDPSNLRSVTTPFFPRRSNSPKVGASSCWFHYNYNLQNLTSIDVNVIVDLSAPLNAFIKLKCRSHSNQLLTHSHITLSNLSTKTHHPNNTTPHFSKYASQRRRII